VSLLSRCLLIGIFLIFSNSSSAQSCAGVSFNSINNPGPYPYSTINQDDGIRNGPAYGDATIYYPDASVSPYASIVIVPGFVSSQSSVAGWGPFLASNGIVTMIIDTNSGFDQPPSRANALLDAIATLREEHERSASPLYNKLDTTKFSVGGWSMGGGGTQLAAAMEPSLKAAIAFCPWLSNPTANDLDHAVPLLILSGQNDGVADPDIHADVHYALTPATTDKLLYEATGGDHYIANDPNNVQGEIGKYGLSWLRYYLLDDPCYCPLVLQSSTLTSEYLTNVACPAICVDGCIDPNFCEYDANATCDDGSCATPNSNANLCNTDCTQGNVEIWNPATCGCEVVSTSVLGCTDANACNYDTTATCDDGSCLTNCCQIPITIVLNNLIMSPSQNYASQCVALDIGFEVSTDFLADIDQCN